MDSIAQMRLRTAERDPWPGIVAAIGSWAAARGASLRDAVVLLPFAQHLPLARAAWAAVGSWMPRIETTQTLARALAPPAPGHPLALTFDASADRIAAERLLRSQAWAVTWARRDPAGHAQALAALVSTAQAIWRAAASVAPASREAHWAQARLAWPAGGGAGDPGVTERALARVALEWAQASIALVPPATDVLFQHLAPFWVEVQAGGADPLAQQLLQAATRRAACLQLLTDAEPQDLWQPVPGAGELQVAVCSGFEEEAQRSAAQVLGALRAGQVPVALVSLDRLLVRRIRALLERQGIPLLDETGWTLSTTRAAASLTGLLAAVHADATADDWIGGLQACAAHWPGLRDGEAALASLDDTVRRVGAARASDFESTDLGPLAAALWRAVAGAAAAWRSSTPLTVGQWLERLHALLDASGLGPLLHADEAGQQVMAAMHQSAALLTGTDEAERAERVSEARIRRWLDEVLEAASFLPAGAADAPVVITPMARAMLRPFAAVVMPGADDRHLGATPAGAPLLNTAEAAALGLPDRAARRHADRLAFAQLLRGAPVTALRRLDDGGEPLAASPLLTQALLARQRAGLTAAPALDQRVPRPLGVAPVQRPQPVAPQLLPATLSASACEALRACPYRFFALRMLKLREAEELDDALEKRDYGNWLHAVLHRFHSERGAPAPLADEAARLHALGRELRDASGISAAAFLPWAASFERLVPRYLAWLHDRDAAGMQWLDGERTFVATPAAWGGTAMKGVIDRIDSQPGDDGPLTQLIDYKTGSASGLKAKVKQPQEDTQLAFYAALLLEQSEALGGVGASYLALDDASALPEIEHPDVANSAHLLVSGLGRDLAALRAGAALPALGEGSVCDFCEARGLCRRDQWAPT